MSNIAALLKHQTLNNTISHYDKYMSKSRYEHDTQSSYAKRSKNKISFVSFAIL